MNPQKTFGRFATSIGLVRLLGDQVILIPNNQYPALRGVDFD